MLPPDCRVLTFFAENDIIAVMFLYKNDWWEQERLFHWHPMKEDIYNQLSAIGNKNNVLVIRKGCFRSDIFYLGKEDDYKYSPNKKWHWGKLYYLKPKD